ncbi:MAG: ABC transporter ATP-binding protein [Firmicutes bacterium]|jgi:ABC-2 type transport system ATP-binding protein|nr:ABC transporter ATP-binding protein [Bacillota bacterium]
MSLILEVKNLKKEFSGFTLDDVTFSLERGYIMGFIGPNGAGKSTTIKLIMNLLKEDGGTISVFGLDHIQHEKEIKNKIGFVYDESYYCEELTIAQMKRIIAPFYKNWEDGVFNRYLRDFGLPPHKKIKELSKGMKMKFSLAVALSHQAELLIMDEPTSGLDPVVRSELLEILADTMQDEQKGVFFSTHITSDLDKIADFITFINNGRIEFSAAKDDILDHFALVKGSRAVLNSDIRKHLVGVRENRFGFEGLTSNKQEVMRLFRENVMVEKPSLEEIMLYYTRRPQNV